MERIKEAVAEFINPYSPINWVHMQYYINKKDGKKIYEFHGKGSGGPTELVETLKYILT